MSSFRVVRPGLSPATFARAKALVAAAVVSGAMAAGAWSAGCDRKGAGPAQPAAPESVASAGAVATAPAPASTPAVVGSDAAASSPPPEGAKPEAATTVPAPATPAPATDAPKPAKLGPVHRLTVKDLDGNDVSLAQFAGRPMIVEIWATWCGPCKVNRRNVHSLKGVIPERVAVVGMSMDTGPQLVKNFLRTNEANPHEFMATPEFNDFIRTINPSGLIPKTLYVDSKGRVADLAEGVQSIEWLKAMSKNLK